MTRFYLAAVVCSVLAGAGAGCSGGSREPRFPAQIAFDDDVLEQRSLWTREQRSAAVYTPADETLPGASLQVGVIVSDRGESDEDLHNWVVDRYRETQGLQSYHLEAQWNWACKVGLPQRPPQPFIAVHLCRNGDRGTACAEVQEELTLDDVGSCINKWSCWHTMCEERWDARHDALETLIENAVGKP